MGVLETRKEKYKKYRLETKWAIREKTALTKVKEEDIVKLREDEEAISMHAEEILNILKANEHNYGNYLIISIYRDTIDCSNSYWEEGIVPINFRYKAE